MTGGAGDEGRTSPAGSPRSRCACELAGYRFPPQPSLLLARQDRRTLGHAHTGRGRARLSRAPPSMPGPRERFGSVRPVSARAFSEPWRTQALQAKRASRSRKRTFLSEPRSSQTPTGPLPQQRLRSTSNPGRREPKPGLNCRCPPQQRLGKHRNPGPVQPGRRSRALQGLRSTAVSACGVSSSSISGGGS